MLMSSQTLTFRPYQKKDIGQIIQLWEKHSGFGGISESTFEQWFINTPFDPCEIIVAENEENNIIGQMVFMPSRIMVNGRVVKSMRVAAPIIHSDFKLTISDLTNNPI